MTNSGSIDFKALSTYDLCTEVAFTVTDIFGNSDVENITLLVAYERINELVERNVQCSVHVDVIEYSHSQYMGETHGY